MDQLSTMRVFVAVAEHEGFAAAGRRLRMSPPAVTRAIAALEDRLGTRLLHRTTRLVRTTDAGARFLADSKRILAEVAEAEASATSAQTELRGPLAVTAPVMFGQMFVAPLLLDFLTVHPRVQLRALLADRVVDLVDEGIDVAIRIARLDARSFDIAVPVGSVRRVLCAAPSLLARHGVPRTPAALARLPAIGFSAITGAGTGAGTAEWSFSTTTGKTEMVRPSTQLIVNSTEVALAAARAGHGVTMALSYQVAQDVLDGTLRIVLARFEPPPIPVHVIHRDGRRASARVRALVDFAVTRLRAEPAVRSRTKDRSPSPSPRSRHAR